MARRNPPTDARRITLAPRRAGLRQSALLLPGPAHGAGAGVGLTRGAANSPSNLPRSVTPLASRSSAPAEASAAFFAGTAPLTMKLAPGSAWNTAASVGIAHPVVRPGEPAAQGQHRAAIDQQPRGRSARPIRCAMSCALRASCRSRAKPPPVTIGLAVGRSAEAPRLQRRVGRDPAAGVLNTRAIAERGLIEAPLAFPSELRSPWGAGIRACIRRFSYEFGIAAGVEPNDELEHPSTDPKFDHRQRVPRADTSLRGC